MTTAGVAAPAMVTKRQAPPKLSLVRGGRLAEPETPVRWARVREARSRITAGYYDRPDVRERVLAAVLDEIEDL